MINVATVPHTKHHWLFNKEIQEVLTEINIPFQVEEVIGHQEGYLVYSTTQKYFEQVEEIIELISRKTPVKVVIDRWKKKK